MGVRTNQWNCGRTITVVQEEEMGLNKKREEQQWEVGWALGQRCRGLQIGLDYQRNVQRTEIALDRQGEVQGLEMGLVH